MKIGDEVMVHGYVDEIRSDVVIIRNEGGYFGTVEREIFAYEEDERGYGTMNEADRKPNSSEIPNNSTGYNLSPVDKDINVRSKDEPRIYVINPQEPTNDEKCFECDDFFTCGGQCNKIEDKPQTSRENTRNSRDNHEIANDEPQVVMPKKCKGCDSASKIIEAYSRGFEDGADAMKAVQTDCSWK